MISNTIQDSCVHLFLISHLVTCYICRLKIFLKTFNLEFSYIDVWLTDQSFKPLEIEHKININLVIN